MNKFPPFVVTAFTAATAAVAFAACGVKAAPTPMMQGFEPRYQSEVDMRVAQNQSATNPAGLAPPIQGSGPASNGASGSNGGAALAPSITVSQPGSAINPSKGTAGSALNSPVITPTAAFTATPVYTAPPVNLPSSTAPVVPQSSGGVAAPQNSPARP